MTLLLTVYTIPIANVATLFFYLFAMAAIPLQVCTCSDIPICSRRRIPTVLIAAGFYSLRDLGVVI
eukprot:Gb_20583 [translate_table: standard]